MGVNFFASCRGIIFEQDPQQKCAQVKQIFFDWQNNLFPQLEPLDQIEKILEPGLPHTLKLVPPLEVPRRRIGTLEGHASLIHALAHIEFNAINLALDACYRFQFMPAEYYADWLKVSFDEAYHFSLLNQHLENLGFYYGSFTAHNGLWDMVVKTDFDVMVRMALVPRVLEARGIDAVPEMQAKILHIGDKRGAEILDIIQHDEISHVQFGSKWFKYLCNERNLNPESTFFDLLTKFDAPKIRGAFNREGRKKAGFSDTELEYLISF